MAKTCAERWLNVVVNPMQIKPGDSTLKKAARIGYVIVSPPIVGPVALAGHLCNEVGHIGHIFHAITPHKAITTGLLKPPTTTMQKFQLTKPDMNLAKLNVIRPWGPINHPTTGGTAGRNFGSWIKPQFTLKPPPIERFRRPTTTTMQKLQLTKPDMNLAKLNVIRPWRQNVSLGNFAGQLRPPSLE